MSDIVSQLRLIAASPSLMGMTAPWCGEAADRIEQLERENAELRHDIERHVAIAAELAGQSIREEDGK